MGTFYRSRHELVFAFKNGSAPHINSFELGQHGRCRTNIWSYKGVNSFGAGRDADLALHPTVKPVAMIADAIKEVSKRGDIVLDSFGGSGSTLIAAHKTGRSGNLCELDAAFCDIIVRRYQTFAKDDAILASTGETFAERSAISWSTMGGPCQPSPHHQQSTENGAATEASGDELKPALTPSITREPAR